MPRASFRVFYRRMPSILHLLSSTADEQTRAVHQMLIGNIGSGFDSVTRRIGAGSDLRNLPASIFKLRKERLDLTYAWGITALAAAVMSGHRRIVFTPDRFAGPRALRWIRSLMDRGNVTMIAPTFTQARIAVKHGIDPDRCEVIPPGVDFGRIRRLRASTLRVQLGLAPDDYVVLVPGETTLASGHDQALWSCGILHVLDPRYKLLMWGRGERAGTTHNLASRLKQPGMVRLAETCGNRTDQTSEDRAAEYDRRIEFEELLSIADLCLVTPAGASPTLPVATAMASGVPIISTVTYMLAELLEDRHTALMVPTRSPRALAQRVLDLRQDPSLQAKLTDKARTEAYEHFSMTRMLDKYREIFAK